MTQTVTCYRVVIWRSLMLSPVHEKMHRHSCASADNGFSMLTLVSTDQHNISVPEHRWYHAPSQLALVHGTLACLGDLLVQICRDLQLEGNGQRLLHCTMTRRVAAWDV